MSKIFKDKKEKYSELKNKITEEYKQITEQYNDYVNNINKVLSVIDENRAVVEGDSLEIVIFKKYLELENVNKVAKQVSELGFKIKTDTYAGQRKFLGTDITDIIEGEALGVDDKLKEVVKWIQKRNIEKISQKNIWL